MKTRSFVTPDFIVLTIILGVVLSFTPLSIIGVVMARNDLFDQSFYRLIFGVIATIKLSGWYIFHGRMAQIVISSFERDIYEFKSKGFSDSIKRFFLVHFLKNHEKLVNHNGRAARWIKHGGYTIAFASGILPVPVLRSLCVFLCGIIQNLSAFLLLAFGNFIFNILLAGVMDKLFSP